MDQTDKDEELKAAMTTDLDEVVDLTEDDLEDGKDSDTDSDAYWSPVEEGDEEAVYASDKVEAHTTDECLAEENIHTAVLMKVDSIDVKEGASMVVLGVGDAVLESGLAQSHNGQPCQQETVQDSKIDCSLPYKSKAVVSVDMNQESVRAFDNEIIRTEAQIVKDEANTGLSAIDEGSEPCSEDEASTFQNYHRHFAENLVKKTQFNNGLANDTVDAVVRSMSVRRPALNIEKCLVAYDIVDQFDVKVSEREELASPSDSGTFMSRLHAVAAGIRRSMSFRKPNIPRNEFEIRERTRRTKSDTWAVRKQPIDDFVNLEFKKRKENNGEILEVIVVSPKVKRKKNTLMANDSTDRLKSEGKDKLNNDVNDVDIGNAHDLTDGPVKLKHLVGTSDDLDIISLSGLEDQRKLNQAEDARQKTELGREGCKDISNGFGGDQPVRPPRKKKMPIEGEGAKPLPMKRGSSESELYHSIGAGLLGIDKGNKLKSTSTYDFKSVAAGGAITSSSEESILKSFLPFLDEKKKTLSNSSSKTLPADKEKLYLFTDAFPTQIPDFPQDRRSLIANEIFTTERTFVRGLELLVQLFKKKALQLGQLDSKEAETVFSNVDEILDFNKGILDDVYQRISNWSDDQIIGDIFVDNAAKFRVYAKFCQNYDTSEEFVKQRMRKKKDFEAFIQCCLGNPSCQVGLSLPSYLITIVQRTPRYILLLKDLLKKTSPAHPDHDNLAKALKAMEDVATHINNQLKLSQSEKALAALQQQIIGLRAYYFSGRTLVHEGPVCLMNIKRTYKCVLFNDLLVFASKGESKQSEVDLVLDLSIVWFQDLEDLDPQTTKEDAIGLYTPDRPYTIYVGAKAAKKLWLQKLNSAVISHNFGSDESKDSDVSKRRATHTYKNGSVYDGEFHDSKREGEGTMMWPNQMTYRGSWIDDERNGHGSLEYGTGEVYEGEFKNDKLHGHGVCRYSNGDEYIGLFKNGVRQGEGKFVFANGDVFEGTFRSDRISGQGKLVCKNGMEYDGSWTRNMKFGLGVLKMSNGDIYEGNFKNDFFNGKGLLKYKTGAIYDGEFIDGQRHGVGTYSSRDGTVYEGDWRDDLKDGTGCLTYSNGDRYEGCFVEDQKCGMGIMKYSGGKSYDGQWKDGLIEGHGTMTFEDGSKYDGNWNSMQRCGQGKQIYSDGSIYEGEWEFDTPSGKGTLEYPNEMKYKGGWLRGKRHGTGTQSDPSNNYKFQGEWKNDKKEGRGIEMLNGVLYEGDFKNDMRDGQGIETAQDKTTFQGNWRLGQKHGKGDKRLLNGMVQRQFWQMGCLMECPVIVPREVPPLKRF